ncbi:SWI/SNF-related matrix-associated actin-dependent regulator of chromatin subfamily A-like protein 1 [Sycon ciliatum]|uniref:SWI/SNF-related matrix-associated actin-dependent regulator of chromatin subfamily A-like protein 1 n=1 Tax=Sycon ciliatum TaxID=27933 RepID=UPI0031F6A67F
MVICSFGTRCLGEKACEAEQLSTEADTIQGGEDAAGLRSSAELISCFGTHWSHAAQCSLPVPEARFGISRNGRVLLADEMGLGKTVQAIALAAYYRNEWPVLIVSPSSVQYMWAKSFLHWIPSLEESDVNVFRKGTDDPNKGLINIASYGLLSRHPKLFQEERYQVVILDESHFIKNRTTQRYKAVAPVLQRASRAILLSGTPALSRPIELYTQVECVRPKLLPYAQEYGIRYCAGFQGLFGWDFTGNSNPLELQNFLKATVMLRRLKAEVMDQMPAKSRKLVLLDPKALTGVRKATKISNALALNSAKGRDQREDTRAMLLELYSISAQSKLPAVKTYIQESLQDVSEKMVVFAHHQMMLDGLEELIKSMKLDFIRIDGKTNSKARQVYCDKFQNDTDCRVALLSITAAGIGITLTAAARAVFTELYWNPGILIQGEDRVYRIGQKSNVAIQYLVAQGTVDDHIWPMVNKKLGVLEQFGVGLGTFKGVDTHVQKSDEGLQPDLFDYWSDVLDVKDVDVAGGEVPVDVTAGDADSHAAAAAPGQCDPPVSGTAGVDIDDDACDVPDIDLDAELKDLNDASAGSWQDEDLATIDVEYAGAEHAEDANSVDFDFHTAASDDDGTGIDYDALLVGSDDEQIMRTSSKAAAGAAADKHSGGVSSEPSAKRRC